MATDSHGMGIPLPADSTKIHQFPAVARAGFEKVAEVMAGGMTEGMERVAGAVLEAAMDGADIITGDDPRVPEMNNTLSPSGEPLAAAIVDAARRLTWLSARASDGGPTDWALKQISDRLGYGMTDGLHPILFSITDAAGRMSDLTVRGSDGQFPDWVVERLAKRMQLSTGGGGSAGQAVNASERYVRGAEVLPVFTDMTRGAGWGSSSMQIIGNDLGAALQREFGMTFHNGGQGGEWSTHISARTGSIPALLTLEGGAIPASGPVKVTASNMASLEWMQAYAGTLAGVAGRLAFNTTTRALEFTRTTAGAAVTVPAGTPYIPTTGPKFRDAVNILWMGKNDLAPVADGREVQTIARTDAMYDWLAPLYRRVIVLGHFTDDGTPAVSPVRDQINAVNAAYARRYGAQYIDVQALLTGPELWKLAGATPTAEDLRIQAQGNKPPSASRDSQHLNAVGNAAVIAAVIARIKSLGWY